MKKANDFLEEIRVCTANSETVQDCYIPINHHAKNLDEYMKEQYFIMLFRALAEIDGSQKTAMSYIIRIAEMAEFPVVSEKIVKYVFSLDDKKMQDCMVSFRDEEIRYLLGFELYIISEVLSLEKNSSYTENIWNGLEISEADRVCYQQICRVLETNDLSNYTQKEYYIHREVISGYLDKLDFTKERCLLYGKFPESSDYSLGNFFGFLRALAPEIAFTWRRTEDFIYIENGEVVSQFDSYQAEIFHAESCTQVVADKSGIIFFMKIKDDSGNEIHISKWCGEGEPFAIIFNQLDNRETAIKFLVEAVKNNKGLDKTIKLRLE